jgi:uncharacterized membrane protein
MPRWLIPASYLLVSFVAAVLVPRLEYRFFPADGNMMSVSTAQTLLGAISSGMMAFTAIVFSIAFLFVQYTATAYSKRFILLTIRKPFVYHAFGLFVSTFTFALGTLAFVNRLGSNWVPLDSVIITGVLLAISIAVMGRLVNQVADLRITRILGYLGDCGRGLILRLPAPEAAASALLELPDEPSQVVRHAGRLMVVTAIDKPGLVRLARDAQVTIRLECAAGDSVSAGSILARIYGARTPIAETALVRCIALRKENFYDTDVRFTLRLLVDAAIMALSHAVNDPTTAVQALDQIEDLMVHLARRKLETGRLADENGEPRLVYPAPTWEDYLALAFDEIRRYGSDSLQVDRRIRAALVHLADAVEDEPRRNAVVEYRRRLDADLERRSFDSTDRATALGIDPQGLGLTRDAV